MGRQGAGGRASERGIAPRKRSRAGRTCEISTRGQAVLSTLEFRTRRSTFVPHAPLPHRLNSQCKKPHTSTALPQMRSAARAAALALAISALVLLAAGAVEGEARGAVLAAECAGAVVLDHNLHHLRRGGAGRVEGRVTIMATT